MALLFCDSFDHYASGDFLEKWTHRFTTTTTIGAVGRNGTNGMTVVLDAGGDGGVRKVLPAAKATLVAGMSFKPLTLTVDIVPILAFDDQTVPGEQISVRFNPFTNKLLVSRNGTTLATGATVLTLGVAVYIEFKATIHDTAGAYTLRINEAVELTASSINTRGSGANNSADAVRIGFSGAGLGSGNVGDFDDFYVCDTLGSENTDFLGDVRVQCLFPDGAGATTQWTPASGPNYSNVDESAPDDDTTYVATGTAGNIDTYTMTNLSASTGTVKGVQTVLSARKDDSGTRTIAPVFRIGVTNYAGTTVTMNTAYSYHLEMYQVSPATAVAFTIAEVNGLEFGPKLVA